MSNIKKIKNQFSAAALPAITSQNLCGYASSVARVFAAQAD